MLSSRCLGQGLFLLYFSKRLLCQFEGKNRTRLLSEKHRFIAVVLCILKTELLCLIFQSIAVDQYFYEVLLVFRFCEKLELGMYFLNSQIYRCSLKSRQCLHENHSEISFITRISEFLFHNDDAIMLVDKTL